MMAANSASALIKAMLEQANYNSHITVVLAEIANRLDESKKDADLIELLRQVGTNGRAVLTALEVVIKKFEEELNG